MRPSDNLPRLRLLTHTSQALLRPLRPLLERVGVHLAEICTLIEIPFIGDRLVVVGEDFELHCRTDAVLWRGKKLRLDLASDGTGKAQAHGLSVRGERWPKKPLAHLSVCMGGGGGVTSVGYAGGRDGWMGACTCAVWASAALRAGTGSSRARGGNVIWRWHMI